MTPAARVQGAIELLDAILIAARDNGPAADALIAQWFKARRYAGSKDRRAVRELVYRAIRAFGQPPKSGRAAVLGLARRDAELAALFDGSPYGPALAAKNEAATDLARLPHWLDKEIPDWLDSDEIAALLDRAPLDLRVNTLAATRDAVIAEFPGAEPIAMTRYGIRIEHDPGLEAHPAWAQGLVEVQDAGSQHIATLCDARPGMTVIDLCAGAGGKALALAADMRGEGRLIASDTDRRRLQQIAPRAARTGNDMIETILLDPGRERDALADLIERADVVLVDAPCSGSGTWRRNPESRWRLNRARLARLIETQAHVLALGAQLVKPGGAMVYAVCSVLDGEGSDQIARFLTENPGWRAVPHSGTPGRPRGAGQILSPHHDGCDGFFIARLERS